MQSLALCLLNPLAAGGRAAALAAPLREALPKVPLFLPTDVASARARLLALPPRSRVIVAGGDGTVHQLLPALVERELELALLPGGTGNDLARALGLHGLSFETALEKARHGLAGSMDLGCVEVEGREHHFMSSLALGFDAAVGARALAAPTWLRGMPRYLWATLAEIGSLRRYPLKLSSGGQVLHEGEMLFASCLNTSSYASGMPVAPGAQIDDGHLDLVCVGRYGRLGALAAMPALLAGQHLRLPGIFMRRISSLQINSPEPLPLALDGEPIPAARSLTVQARPLALRVVRGG
ncbi:diacylglycerol kinase family protein [Pelomonas sp. SE-A7]|uniref:diacylglycerol/lipid kinase family protein n=1 Tax=Pelomonas sp. SE-A7 TaxID=3054953 RepID=UPI00259CF7BA|nr:diacylglycerol kinase family protein [Pelomonas sp. SE-A7]MDM4767939.1 diacylglycerol kinase family protein [Pelomonas sp. SE-A7]